MKQLNGFSATHYNAEEWVKLIQNSGAKYTVITTRHHDGVSLWDTKADNAISIKNNSLAKKDVLTPFITALKKTNLKTGLYYSLPDWSHPNYDINTRTKTRYKIAEDSKRWQKYINWQLFLFIRVYTKVSEYLLLKHCFPKPLSSPVI